MCTHFSFEITSKVVFSTMWFFPIVYEVTHWNVGKAHYFPAAWRKKIKHWRIKCEEASAYWLHLCFLSDSWAVRVKDSQCSPCSSTTRSWWVIVSLQAIIVSSCHLKEMLGFWLPGRSALRSGVYNFAVAFCKGCPAGWDWRRSEQLFFPWWLPGSFHFPSLLHTEQQGLHSYLHCYREEH